MAQTLRASLSAQQAGAVLYLAQAEDALLNLPAGVPLQTAAQAVLRHPNMNDTGRMPAIGLLHVGMEVRLTVTCLLYTSPSPRDKRQSRMPSSA